MGDLNRLKELLQSLDCRSLDPEAIEAIRKIVVELNATVPVYGTGHRMVHWVARLKVSDITARECRAIIDEFLKLLN